MNEIEGVVVKKPKVQKPKKKKQIDNIVEFPNHEQEIKIK
jgi:hypothetical protein